MVAEAFGEEQTSLNSFRLWFPSNELFKRLALSTFVEDIPLWQVTVVW